MTQAPPAPQTTEGPLSGVVVADFSRVLAGPLASMFLGDLGATVIKVERAGVGDDSRAWGPPYIGRMSAYYSSVNRNKRSIALDLTEPGDLVLAHALVDRADVLIENFLPGKLAQFGLDEATLRRTHPELVYCSISGFGSGAGAQLPGYDFIVQALGGLMSITGDADGGPTKVGIPVVDVLTGLHATIGILGALCARGTGHPGQHVEVNLLSSLIASLVNQGATYVNGAGVPSRKGNQHPNVAPYETLATKDGTLAVAVGNDRQFRRFAELIGAPELGTDPRFGTNHDRVSARDELVDALERALSADTAAAWNVRLQAAGIPSGLINDIAGAVDLASGLGLEPLVPFGSPDGEPTVTTLSNPIRLSGTPVRYRRRPPLLGADSDEVRAWLSSDDTRPLQDAPGQPVERV